MSKQNKQSIKFVPQTHISEFTTISGLLKKSDAEIAQEMSKVKDFKRLALKLSIYDDLAIQRIVNGLPPEKRQAVKKMTVQLKDVNYWTRRNPKNGAPAYGRLIYETTHINLKKIMPSLILALVLLAISGYMV